MDGFYLMAFVKIDPSAKAAYISINHPQGDEGVSQTVPVSANLDLDANGHVVGIEILDWPS